MGTPSDNSFVHATGAPTSLPNATRDTHAWKPQQPCGAGHLQDGNPQGGRSQNGRLQRVVLQGGAETQSPNPPPKIQDAHPQRGATIQGPGHHNFLNFRHMQEWKGGK